MIKAAGVFLLLLLNSSSWAALFSQPVTAYCPKTQVTCATEAAFGVCAWKLFSSSHVEGGGLFHPTCPSFLLSSTCWCLAGVISVPPSLLIIPSPFVHTDVPTLFLPPLPHLSSPPTVFVTICCPDSPLYLQMFKGKTVKLFFFFSLWPPLHDEGSLFKPLSLRRLCALQRN